MVFSSPIRYAYKKCLGIAESGLGGICSRTFVSCASLDLSDLYIVFYPTLFWQCCRSVTPLSVSTSIKSCLTQCAIFQHASLYVTVSNNFPGKY